ncbi:MAG: glycosyltransferase family 4 protein [Ignavibacteriales bacterium]|nr:glycosyltransferase family 4 protein [Ignavibacteriales bacterium]
MKEHFSVVVIDPFCQVPYYNQYLCSALAQNGVSVTLWTRIPPSLRNYFSRRNFSVRRISRFSSDWFSRQSLVAKIIKYGELIFLDLPRLFFFCLRCDVLHVQWLSPFPFYYGELFLYRALQLLGKKVVFTAHNIFPHDADANIKRRYVNIYSYFDSVLVPTEFSKRIFQQNISHKTAVTDIPHGPLFHDGKKIPSTEAKTELRLSEESFVVLFQGLIRPYKGVEFLVETFAEFIKSVPNAVLLVVGTGDEHYLQSLRKKISSLHIPPPSVVCKFDYVGIDELSLYYSSADVAVFPYRAIYQSGALMTAMSFRKAVIATNVGGFPEVIENDINGKLIEYGNIQQFLSALNALYSSKEKREQLGTNAFDTVTNKFSWEMIAEKTINVYREP